MASGCGCSGSTGCPCKIIAGNALVDVEGSGTQSDPYRIAPVAMSLLVQDSTYISLTKGSGDGSAGNPWLLTATLLPLPLDALSDVAVGSATSGQVLAYNATTHTWGPVPPSTATPGAINNGNGISGDGSSGSPIAFDPLTTGTPVTGGAFRFSSGFADLSLAVWSKLGIAYANAAARDAVITAPGNGDSAMLLDRLTLTLYMGGRWWEVTPEIAKTWVFPRTAGDAGFTSPGADVASGTVTAAIAGRYRIDYGWVAHTADGTPLLSMLTQLKVGTTSPVVIEESQQDLSWPFARRSGACVYTHVGGDLALTLRAQYITLTDVAPVQVYQEGTGIIVTYLGRT